MQYSSQTNLHKVVLELFRGGFGEARSAVGTAVLNVLFQKFDIKLALARRLCCVEMHANDVPGDQLR